MGGGGGAAERGLRGRRVEQITLQIQHGGAPDQRLVHIRLAERHAGAEIRVHRALPIRRHQDQAARGGGPALQRRRGEMHPRRRDVAPERLAQRIARDLAQIGHLRPQATPPPRRCWRPSRRCSRLPGGIVGIQRAGRRLVDQRHAPLVHGVLGQECLGRGRHHIDDRVADADDIVVGGGGSGHGMASGPTSGKCVPRLSPSAGPGGNRMRALVLAVAPVGRPGLRRRAGPQHRADAAGLRAAAGWQHVGHPCPAGQRPLDAGLGSRACWARSAWLLLAFWLFLPTVMVIATLFIDPGGRGGGPAPLPVSCRHPSPAALHGAALGRAWYWRCRSCC